MSSIDDDVDKYMAAHAQSRRHCERHFYKDSRREHLLQLALRGPTIGVEFDVAVAHMRALGVDVAPIYEKLDALRETFYRAVIPVLSEAK